MAFHPIPTPNEAAPKAPSRLPSPNLAAEEDRGGRVKDSPSGNYVLAHPKDEWQLNANGDLVPVLVQLSRTPGVQGVGTRGEFGAAQAYYLERGFTLIPHDILPTDYVALYLNRKGQRVHRSVFQSPIDGPNGTIWTCDEESIAKFIKLLRIRGFIRPPRPHIVRGMLHTKQQEYDHLRPPSSDDASRRDVYDRRVVMLRKQIKSLEAELEAAVVTFGDDAAPVSNTIGDLLAGALAEAEAESAAVEEVKGKARKGKA